MRKLDGPDTCQKEKNEPFDKHKFEKDIFIQVEKTIVNPRNKSVYDSKNLQFK